MHYYLLISLFPLVGRKSVNFLARPKTENQILLCLWACRCHAFPKQEGTPPRSLNAEMWWSLFLGPCLIPDTAGCCSSGVSLLLQCDSSLLLVGNLTHLFGPPVTPALAHQFHVLFPSISLFQVACGFKCCLSLTHIWAKGLLGGTEMVVLRESGFCLTHIGWWSWAMIGIQTPEYLPISDCPSILHCPRTQRRQDLSSWKSYCWNGSGVLGPKAEPYITWRIYFQSYCSIIALTG